ncbi:MAG TPA: hypothetical protein ENJ45_01920 [Phaeodactylibacter sp.]|nr:hypothetical protein [Phaeodactylibacter sp.]
MRRIILLSIFFISMTSCYKTPEVPVYLTAKICFKVQHHERPIPNINVHIKYGDYPFSGYDAMSQYDTMIVSDEFGDVCFPAVPLGKNQVIGIGVDELLEEPVRGSLPFEVKSLMTWDTTLYVSEY